MEYPNPKTCVSRRRKFGSREKRGKPCEDKGRYWKPSMSQRIPRNTSSFQTEGLSMKDSPLQSSKEPSPVMISMPDFQPPAL